MAKDEFSVGLLYMVSKLMNTPVAVDTEAVRNVRLKAHNPINGGMLFIINKFLQNPAAFRIGVQGNAPLKPYTLVLQKLAH